MTTTTTTTVDRLLDALASGDGVPPELFAPEAVLDATVPDWRFALRGADAVARQYSYWCALPSTFEELERLPVEGGEVVTYLIAWVKDGVPHAAHHCHRLRLDDEGCIAFDRFFCGGQWNAARLAEMAAAAPEHAR